MSREYTLQRAPTAATISIDYAGELNEQQYAAVTAPPGPLLVIAGAGSGKTRTLTYRVAYLLENGVDPRNILLLTFTNKAARQMLDRVANLLPTDASGLWGGTFHSIGNRMLRRHGSALGYTSGFTIMTIWGNHSATQYPDFYNAKINDQNADKVINDEKWLKETFIPAVQQRGAAIIKARGSSSAASAANAVVDTVRSLTTDTKSGDWHSVAVCSDGSYGVEKDLISSFPIHAQDGKWEIVQEVPINDFSRSKIDASVTELKEEKALVKDFIS